MKYSLTKILILVLFFASAMILGCGEKEQPPKTEAPAPAEKTQQEIEEAAEIVESVTEYTFEKKEEYTAKINEQLLNMDEKIQEIKDKALTMEGEAREAMEQQIDDLTAMYEKASVELANIKEKGAEGWAEAMSSLNTAMEQLKQVYEESKAGIE